MMTIAILICAMGCSARQTVVAREDVSITDDVRARLAADAQASPSEIAVDTKAGIVHLTGTVATDGERTSIERIARDAPGVCAVDNDVRFGDVPVRVKPTTY
jgi:osmotically-inducible protein OsmY